MPRAIGEAILKNKSKCSSCEKDIFKLRLTIENHTNGFNKIRETLNSRYWVTRRSGNLSVALVSDDIIHMSERVAVSIIHCDLTMRSTRLYSYLDALLIKSTLQMLERICAFSVSSAIGAAAMHWNDTWAATPRILFSRTVGINLHHIRSWCLLKNGTRSVDVI